MNVEKITLREIPLQELPLWSRWPERLLGLTEWTAPSRTVEKVASEYDKDEYLRCLNFIKEQPTVPSPDRVREHEFRYGTRKSLCVSQKGTLYEMPEEYLMNVDRDLLLEVMEPLISEADTVVEIGCGYGINLWELCRRFPKKTYRGGEYSPNAVQLAGMIFKDLPQISVERCNFYDAKYDVLEKSDQSSRTVVFTRHAIEQLPTAAPFIEALKQYFDRIAAVVHLEVVHENNDDTLLGLLRKSYTHANDYNRDLLTLLKNRKDIEITKNEPDVYGVNPLNPTSIVVWRPC